jgi:2-polyprenyl-3-methyl-5-hydroxy-6-metoxy-1,4-benzoquinol methylase
MKFFDRVLQYWRIAKARPYIQPGGRVLDIGCADGAMFRYLEGRIEEGLGIDPDLDQTVDMGSYQLIRGWFPQDLPDDRLFDAITLLAVVEHLPAESLTALAQNCARYLKPGGYLIVTVPESSVDRILDLLKLLRIIDGMSLEEHYGFDSAQAPSLFAVDGMRLYRAGKFQLGLNNLFVFEKTEGST